MTSQADFDRFVESQRGVRRLALRDLAAWWVTVEHLSPSEIKREAQAFLPLISHVSTRGVEDGEPDAMIHARADSAARGRFTATLPASGAASQASRYVSWATDPLFVGEAADALDRMSGVVDAAALQDGRSTVIHNANRDPAKPRWARVPVGKTCAWCLMLASRGAVYRSAQTAGSATEFHRACDCQPTPSWDWGRDLPPSYDEGELYGVYERARADAGSGDTKQITAAMRRLDGGSLVADGVKPKN